jgi:D-amino peptidase
MEVFISVDMEGIAGVAHGQQVTRGSDDFPASRALMTEEANAAIAGAFDGGAAVVVVNDSHGDMYNLLAERLDPRAELTLGSPKVPLSMMQGLGPEFGVALFIGYHAGAGTEAAVLDHTYAGRSVYDVRVNGESWTEAELNAGVAGTFGVPVGLVTGDDKICAVVTKRLHGVRTVEVKEGYGATVARSLHPSNARRAIREAAAAAVAGAAELEPFAPSGPYAFEVDLMRSRMADLCALLPGSERLGARTVRFETNDYLEGFRCLLAWTYLAAQVA